MKDLEKNEQKDQELTYHALAQLCEDTNKLKPALKLLDDVKN